MSKNELSIPDQIAHAERVKAAWDRRLRINAFDREARAGVDEATAIIRDLQGKLQLNS